MSFQRSVKTILAAALFGMSIAGCSGSDAQDGPVKVLSPTGAPALAAMNTLGDGKDEISVDYVEGQDNLISELSKKDSEYDIIFAPVNLGVKTWSEAETWQLEGIVTWGNLYIVSSTQDWNNPEVSLAAFGEGAVPGMVFNSLYPDIQAETSWYPSVAEASQALLSGNADAALLAQPIAAAAIAKAQDAGNELFIAADLQQEWLAQHNNTGQSGYPQAAVFIKKGTENKTAKAIENMKSFLEDPDADLIQERVDLYGADVLGVPSAQMAAATWQAQNIHYVKASEVKDDIQAFLDLFGMTLDDAMIVS